MAKGLGIIAVVVGHSGSKAAHFLYWFHIPLFFVISGYLFKPLLDWEGLFTWASRRTRQIIVPYISFLGIIVIIEFYLNNKYLSLHKILNDFIVNLFPGGRLIGGFYTPFWFITCFFATQIIFALIIKTFKSKKVQITIIALAYILAHIESILLKSRNIVVPWDIDASLLTLTYFSIGYYLRAKLESPTKMFSQASMVLTAVIAAGGVFGFINYSLNIKYLGYEHVILDIVIPTSITFAIIMISKKYSDLIMSRCIAILGVYSLPIMYLHLPINIILHEYVSYGPTIFTLIGLAFPIVLSRFVLARFKITRILLLGNTDSRQFKHSLPNITNTA